MPAERPRERPRGLRSHLRVRWAPSGRRQRQSYEWGGGRRARPDGGSRRSSGLPPAAALATPARAAGRRLPPPSRPDSPKRVISTPPRVPGRGVASIARKPRNPRQPSGIAPRWCQIYAFRGPRAPRWPATGPSTFPCRRFSQSRDPFVTDRHICREEGGREAPEPRLSDPGCARLRWPRSPARLRPRPCRSPGPRRRPPRPRHPPPRG
jgi:hypothetical protein